MPWMDFAMPAIQLATLARALQEHGIASEIFEFYLDYAKRIGHKLYRRLSFFPGFTAEWLFAQHYFGPEIDNWLNEYRSRRPPFSQNSTWFEDQILDQLIPITATFLDDLTQEEDWSKYSVLGFTITTLQLGASMALARKIKLAHPDVPIVFGGACCAGPMGTAILRACPYVDVVVRVEGEPVFPELIQLLARGKSLGGVPGISWRDSSGEVVSNPLGGRFNLKEQRPPLNYDSYFERLKRLGMADKVEVWLPFESCRGCWHAQKSPCKFCGRPDYLEFGTRKSGHVLTELEAWAARYKVTRFRSVDLNFPRKFFKSLLPEISERGHLWSLNLETKADLSRKQVKTMAKAGVSTLHAGIETLDQEALDLMGKKVSVLQNIQLLKWCQEYGIRSLWNFLYGIPEENREMYERIAKRIPLLHHLKPPIISFRLHLTRFSPYFEEPHRYGITKQGVLPIYHDIFPVAEEILDDLFYMQGYTFENFESVDAWVEPVLKAIEDWKAAHNRAARLDFYPRADGSGEIIDTRFDQEYTYSLNPSEVKLYQYFDCAKSEAEANTHFGLERNAQASSFSHILKNWEDQGLILRDQGQILALAVQQL